MGKFINRINRYETMADKIWTMVRMKRTTTSRVRELGYKGETYDDIINRTIDRIEELEEYIKKTRGI